MNRCVSSRGAGAMAKYPLTRLKDTNNLAFVSAPLSAYAGRTRIASGTGFFYSPSFSRTFLITNRHVVVKEATSFYPDALILKLHTDGDDLTQSSNLTLPLYSIGQTPTWRQISDSVDVVALELDTDELKRFVVHAFTPLDMITPDIIVGVGDPLVVIGYPKGFSDEVHNLPVFRRASVASVYPIPFGGKPCFLIDSELHPGTSGSAVITQPSIWEVNEFEAELFDERRYKFIGVHSASYGDLKLNVVWFADLVTELTKE
jgi:S1-C subfamily serine protease